MSDRPRVVLLSHQACTGGTLWMRTLGAMDGVRTLSEISADAEPEPGRFAPLAPIEQYALAEGVDWLPDLVTDQVLRVATHCHDNGSVLLLRLHSHSSFVRKGAPGRDTLLGRLRARDDIEAHAVWTIRHPVASYASLVKNRWHGGHTLESYSRAYRAFVAEQVEIEAKGPFRYESLTESPDETLRAVCDAVQLPYSQQYR
ncbi:MAG: sulfotransferase, partial [Myxococcota bacterium]